MNDKLYYNIHRRIYGHYKNLETLLLFEKFFSYDLSLFFCFTFIKNKVMNKVKY